MPWDLGRKTRTDGALSMTTPTENVVAEWRATQALSRSTEKNDD